MATKTITIEAENEMDLLIKVTALNKLKNLPSDQIKRLGQLSDNEKARGYLSSEAKFSILKVFLK